MTRTLLLTQKKQNFNDREVRKGNIFSIWKLQVMMANPFCSLPAIFERAFDYFRTNEPELKEERAMLLDDWLNVEISFGSIGDVSIVKKKLPRKVKRKRAITAEDGSHAGYDSYFPLIYWFLDNNSIFTNNPFIGIENFAVTRNISTTFSLMKRWLQSLKFWKLRTNGKSNELILMTDMRPNRAAHLVFPWRRSHPAIDWFISTLILLLLVCVGYL